MTNKKNFFILLTFIMVFSLYRSESAAAIADSRSGASGMETALSTETKPESVSNGTELMEWMDSHKKTGGTVKLSGNITLDEYYCFVSSGINGPSIFIDTGNYTITVTGEVEFFSSYHLTFSGQAADKGIFHVAGSGLLSLTGVSIENSPYALWQEEGTGLIVDNCRITGNIHYADTPFVLYKNSGCAIVEPGQTADDVLPSEIKCKVNYQGQVNHNEMVPVVWNQKGTEQYQENRLRFQMLGSFPNAASQMQPFCTVAYNDYPLTFTEVDAVSNGNMYMFQGSYTKPEENLPITVLSEYSFDGKNWHIYSEDIVSDIYEVFFIGLMSEEWNTAIHPWLYIRLQWQDGETPRFSNVLRYNADNLGHAEDQGGNRGGGTSIVNPPDEPQKDPDNTSSKDSEPTKNKDTDIHNPDTVRQSDPPEAKPAENTSSVQNRRNANAPENREHVTYNNSAAIERTIDAARADTNAKETAFEDEHGAAPVSAYGKNSENPLKFPEPITQPDSRRNRNLFTIAGFISFAILAGAAGFCFHAGLFRKLFHKIKK